MKLPLAYAGDLRRGSDTNPDERGYLICRRCGGRTRSPEKHFVAACGYNRAVKAMAADIQAAHAAGLSPIGSHYRLLRAAGVPETKVAAYVHDGGATVYKPWIPAWALILARLGGPIEWRYFLLATALRNPDVRQQLDAIRRLTPENDAARRLGVSNAERYRGWARELIRRLDTPEEARNPVAGLGSVI